MALESGMRRVRMVGAEHWTDTPERELPTIAAGGDTYAVHERVCIDSARVRLVLAEGEDVAGALREVYGEAVRDVRVFRLVEGSQEVVEGLPEWRLTLPLSDDAEHDPLLSMIARLAGVASPAPVVDSASDEVPALEPFAPAPPGAEVPALDVPALEPVVALAEEPVAELDDQPPFVLPAGLVMPEELAVDESVADLVEAVEAVEVTEVVEAIEVTESAEPAEPAELAEGFAALEAAGIAAALLTPEAPATEQDPYAVPDETVFPVEAAAEPEPEPVVEAAVEPEPEPEPVPVPEPVADGVPDAVADAVIEPVADAVIEQPEPEPESEPEPDPRDLAHAAVAAVLDSGRPTCAAVDRDGPCSAASDVIWQSEAGAAWACAWHWPSAMAGYPGAEVGAVQAAGRWSTWRDGGSVELARQAADLFAEAARGHEHPVARPLVALDRLDEMLRSLPDDLRGAILLWAISVTNPDWDVAAVAEHGRATHDLVATSGRAVAFPDEIYFQQQVASAPVTTTAPAAEASAPASSQSGESLFARGTALASAGDLRAASQAWTEAAEDHNHALAMRALGDLSQDRDDRKTAEEWYGRAAMLNDTTSMTRIALLLESRGQQERAAEWLRRAARFGDEDAARRLQSQGVVGASA